MTRPPLLASLPAAAACAAVLAAPVRAQEITFEEAAALNAQLALGLCLTGGADRAAWAQGFRDAGFAETVERSATNSDTTHTFTAPADTVVVELYYGEQPEYCAVRSDHMGVTAASSVLDAVVPRIHPGYVRKVQTGPADPATGQPALCARYEDPTNPIGHVVGVAAGAGAEACVANGTSTFYSSYRV